MSMKQKMVIGVAGMPGAGKASVKAAAESMGYPAIVMGDVIRDETKRRGLEPTPENIGKIMLKLREEEGSSAVARRCIPAIQNAESNVVFLDGVRSLHEVDEFKKCFPDFILIAVHSSPETRFQRLSKRKRSDDPKGWDVFLRRDKRELSVGQGDVIAMADYMIVNESTYNEFQTRVRQVLEAVVRNG
jgi:dephospho-CoA kinase